MQTAVSLTSGHLLAPDGNTIVADLHIAGDQIVDSPAAGTERIDCTGYHVLPGIVDVHGDAFEQVLHPRPGVEIAFPIAMASVDRQLLANGITTAYHGLTVSWEPGMRSLAAARRFLKALPEQRPRLVANHRVQLRWETFAHDAVDDIDGWLGQEPAPAIAFNDHTTSTLETVKAGDRIKLDQWARKAGVSLDEYLAGIDAVGRRGPAVADTVAAVAAMARNHGAVMLAHDEATVTDRASHRDLGMSVSEFPLAPDVAADAVAHGEPVVMGGPNAIRGGSHKGFMSAEDAIRDGICTVLASDYYYPSLYHAVERLVTRGVLPVAEAWALVSRNAAAAMGLDDRGTLAVGRRADVVVVDCTGPWRLVHAIAGGVWFRFGR